MLSREDHKVVRLKNPRIAIILVTLLMIVVMGGLLVNSEQHQRLNQVYSDGQTLTRILSDLPNKQLVSGSSISGLSRLLKSYSSDNSLVYVVVADSNGATVNQIVSIGIDPPAFDMRESTGFKQLTLRGGDVEIIEFQAPVLDSQQHIVGHVRTGYASPPLGLPDKVIFLFAQIALLIFLLVPVFYFFLSSGLKPLQDANRRIRELIGEQRSDEGIPAEPGEFVNNFNDFIHTAKQQMGDLETQKLKALTSIKILNYHKKRVETTLQTIPDAVIVIDESGMATFANNRVSSLIGQTSEDIVGKLTNQWCVDRSMSALLSKYQSNITSIKREEVIEFNPDHNNSKTVWARVYPLFSTKDSSIVLGTLVVLRDITEEVMARQSRDEFIAHVSHELKSPLNIIALRSELLLDLEPEESDQLVDNINIIQSEVNRMVKLINDLLDITQIETGSVSLNRKRVKLRAMLEDIHKSFLSAAQQKNITLELDLPQNLSTMNIDKELMRVAINNLLSNAIKYSDAGTTISIVVEESDEQIDIKVEDRGIGISPKDLKLIFNKFYRSEAENVRQQAGHGLGLSLAHEIVSLHHGELSAQSEQGEGTTFTIQLMKTSTLLKEAS